MTTQDPFLKALVELNDEKYFKKIWLMKYFSLYKSTLNWPPNLHPINRTSLIKGTLKEKFNSVYYDILSEFDHELDNGNQTIIINHKRVME
jgi:hypothetical protein